MISVLGQQQGIEMEKLQGLNFTKAQISEMDLEPVKKTKGRPALLGPKQDLSHRVLVKWYLDPKSLSKK